jgi:hypothetical protein
MSGGGGGPSLFLGGGGGSFSKQPVGPPKATEKGWPGSSTSSHPAKPCRLLVGRKGGCVVRLWGLEPVTGTGMEFRIFYHS